MIGQSATEKHLLCYNIVPVTDIYIKRLYDFGGTRILILVCTLRSKFIENIAGQSFMEKKVKRIATDLVKKRLKIRKFSEILVFH